MTSFINNIFKHYGCKMALIDDSSNGF